MRIGTWICLFLVLTGKAGAVKVNKKDIVSLYKKKFLVVQRDGLAIGLCSASSRSAFSEAHSPGGSTEPLTIRINGLEAEYHEQTGISALVSGCASIVGEPIHIGEVLTVDSVTWLKNKLWLTVHNVSPHQIERGVGAYSHQTIEKGSAVLIIAPGANASLDAVIASVEQWVKPFDSQTEAVSFGNTKSGVYVKQIKLGMTLAEVEAELGVPATRADLGDKVLYKYKDMSIEFREGKVVDVK